MDNVGKSSLELLSEIYVKLVRHPCFDTELDHMAQFLKLTGWKRLTEDLIPGKGVGIARVAWSRCSIVSTSTLFTGFNRNGIEAESVIYKLFRTGRSTPPVIPLTNSHTSSGGTASGIWRQPKIGM